MPDRKVTVRHRWNKRNGDECSRCGLRREGYGGPAAGVGMRYWRRTPGRLFRGWVLVGHKPGACLSAEQPAEGSDDGKG